MKLLTREIFCGCVSVVAGSMLCGQVSLAEDKSDKVLARFADGKELTYAEFAERNPALVSWFGLGARVEDAEQSIEAMVFNKLLAKEASKSDVLEKPEVKQQLDQISAQAFLVDRVPRNKIFIDEKELTRYYAEHREEYLKPVRLRVSHILVKTKEEAEKLQKSLQQGTSFDNLAKKYSQDPSSGARGGALGRVSPDDIAPEIWKAVENKENNAIVGPVQTVFGYHLVRVDEKPYKDYKPFEEVKEDIYKTIFAQKEGKMVEDLKKELWEKYDVEIDLTALKGLVTDRAGAEARAPGEIAFGTGEASNKGNSHLRFISEAVDLGLVRTKPVSFTSLVKNTATEDLIIQKVGSSCKCAEAKIEPRKLAPGAVGKLTVSFDPKKLEKREIGDASKILIIDSTDRVQPRKFVRVDAHLVQNNG